MCIRDRCKREPEAACNARSGEAGEKRATPATHRDAMPPWIHAYCNCASTISLKMISDRETQSRWEAVSRRPLRPSARTRRS
eukprot:2190897-Alexandrium_andersonii.AAC.1